MYKNEWIVLFEIAVRRNYVFDYVLFIEFIRTIIMPKVIQGVPHGYPTRKESMSNIVDGRF